MFHRVQINPSFFLFSPCISLLRCKLRFPPRGSGKCYSVCLHACFQHTNRNVLKCASVCCVCSSMQVHMVMCGYAFIPKRKEEKEGATCSIKGTESPGDKSAEPVCVLSCVCVCVCQPVPAQYPSIQPAPGTVVHPTRHTVALFISETHSFCVCEKHYVCLCLCMQVHSFWHSLKYTHKHTTNTNTHTHL